MSINDDFYELCYEAWLSGRDPDTVSRNEYDRLLSRGYSPDEISWQDCYPEETETEGEE